ncbi:hypothetical protein BDD12DRAFT_890732 [Trichophaea hybrida]|nr:hypothetical protein BDD12DRAFT_890732 [Trichophaea hybrida]
MRQTQLHWVDCSRAILGLGGRRKLVEASKFLISKGADVNYFDKKSSAPTALAAAAKWGNIDVINVLLKHGADILLGTEKGAISELWRLRCEATSKNRPGYDETNNLIKKLENLEREEREKRNLPEPTVTVTATGLPPYFYFELGGY